MNKFDLIEKRSGVPKRIFALPELVYPDRFNVARALFEKAGTEGWNERPAYFFDGATVSYDDLKRNTARLARLLIKVGVEPGDRVILRFPDTPDLVAAILAVQAIGAVAVATFVQLRLDDLVYRVADTEARTALVDSSLADEFGCRRGRLPRSVGGAGIADTIRPAGSCRWPIGTTRISTEIPYADTQADDLALIAYTSGTTGRPKGTAHCHRDLMASADTYSRHCIGTRPDDVFAGPPSLPFTMGTAFFVYYTLRFGAAAIMSADKSVEAYAELVRRHGATVFVGVPTYYNRLLAHVLDTGDTFPSLRMTLIGGEPLYPELEDAWRETMGLPLEQFIGSTEMFHIYIGYRHGVDAPRTGVLGRAIPGYEITVRDPETFAEMPNGEHGLLCSRGPSATVYWSPRDVQTEMVRDGWNIAKDTVWRDDDGFIHFVSRADEMIVTGGFNVAPADVEQVLIKHPAVLECACAPSPDETRERSAVVKAFIVAAPGHDPTPALGEALQQFFKENGPPFMYPRKIEFLDALPKGLTGKVLRGELKRREMGG